MVEQTGGYVLATIPYGETSLIVKLFTKEFGLISVLIKGGVRKKYIPESGARISLEIRRRNSSGLFLSYSCEEKGIYQFHHSLLKTALRDTAFEMILSYFHEEEPHKEVYLLVERYLSYLEETPDSFSLYGLWLFILRLSQSLGFAYSLWRCALCNSPLEEARLTPVQGGFICRRCNRGAQGLFPHELMGLLRQGRPGPEEVVVSMTAAQKRYVTEELMGFLATHSQYGGRNRAATFLFDVLARA
ncbi:DNA repair protein RecO [Chitinivibrio alkaliphilus]|uniref:DNA repair protein RecO n=1 Tax=Chitinivibrio alkaliphilus ACht1 TaxID=1313304 RepID=U7DA13_9BACT|nr:DNA repair protein RecO [Chitinivibrio alkaliphilus]ERP39249.1 DNA repair protein RecO [Chitinivibrio alkaliphilus ACht1]